MLETQKGSGMVLTGTAHLDGHINSEDHERIEFMLAGDCIYMEQVSRCADGTVRDNEVTIQSQWQAQAVIQIIRAMAAAEGWEL
jgi:hypothetical protein